MDPDHGPCIRQKSFERANTAIRLNGEILLDCIRETLIEWRWAMTMSLEAAAQVMREAMRETVKRHSLWYLVQGGLMILAGILALVFPAISSVAVVVFLGWLLILSVILQAFGLFGAVHVPPFWLLLASV